MPKAVSKVKLKKIATVALLVICIGVCAVSSYAWFIMADVSQPAMNMVLTDRAFTMGDFKIIADGEDTKVNEFSGLLPGSEFRFELLINRKIDGELRLKLEIKGIYGDTFIGKQDKTRHSMLELFCVRTADADGMPTGDPIYFDNSVDGSLLVYTNQVMAESSQSLTLVFYINFSADKVGIEQLSNEINRKQFGISSMYVSSV